MQEDLEYIDFLDKKIKYLKNHIKWLKEYFRWFKWTNIDTLQEQNDLIESEKLLFLYNYELNNGKKFINWIDWTI